MVMYNTLTVINVPQPLPASLLGGSDGPRRPLRAGIDADVKGGAKVDHWGGAKGYQQREL
jgi:hypothetical protein